MDAYHSSSYLYDNTKCNYDLSLGASAPFFMPLKYYHPHFAPHLLPTNFKSHLIPIGLQPLEHFVIM